MLAENIFSHSRNVHQQLCETPEVVLKRLSRMNELDGIVTMMSYYQSGNSKLNDFINSLLLNNVSRSLLEDVIQKTFERSKGIVKANLLTLIGELRLKKYVSHVITSFRANDEEVVRCSIRAAGYLRDKRAATPLADLLNHVDDTLKYEVLYALSLIKDKSVTDDVLKLYSTKNKELLISSINVLKKIHSRKAINPTIGLLERESDLIKLEALKLLETFYEYSDEQVDKLMSFVDNKNRLITKGIVNILLKDKNRRVIEVLHDLLKSDDTAIRRYAMKSLIEMEDVSSMNVVIEMLDDPNKRVRYEALRFVKELGNEKHIKYFINALNDEWKRIRSLALTTLTYYKAKRIFEVLRKYYDRTNSISERKRIIEYFSKINTNKSYNILVELLSLADNELRPSIIRSLGMTKRKELLDALVPYLTNDDEEIVTETIKAVSSIRDSKIRKLLLTLLNNDNEEIVICSVNALGNYNSLRIAERLIDKYNSTSKNVKLAIIKVLPKLKFPVSYNKILEILNSSEDSEILIDAIRSVIHLRRDDLLNKVYDFVDHKKINVRRTAIQVLGIIHDKKSLTKLLSKLDDSHVIIDVLAAINRYHDLKTIIPLVNKLNSSNVGVINFTTSILKKYRSDEAITIMLNHLDSCSDNAKEHLINVIGFSQNKIAVEKLISYLDYQNPIVVRSVIDALSRMNAVDVEQKLIKMIDNADDKVRKQIVVAIRKLRLINAYNKVKPMLLSTNEDIKQQAIITLFAISNDKAIKDVLPLLNNKNRETIYIILHSLRKYQDIEKLVDYEMAYWKNDREIIREYVKVLSRAKDKKRAYEILKTYINHDDKWVRFYVYNSIEKLSGIISLKLYVSNLDEEEMMLRNRLRKAIDRWFREFMVLHLSFVF